MPQPRGDNPALEVERRKINEVKDLGDENLRKATPKVRELRVKDLNDLARKLHGLDVRNPTVDDLSVEDYRSIEEVFQGYKQQLLERAERGENVVPGEEEIFDNWSCCCCTPCCCCAAADVDPFAA
jgi:hypothetical protein